MILDTNNIKHLHCNSCGKQVSTGFIPIPTDTPDRGIIVRAWIECPECLEKKEKSEVESMFDELSSSNLNVARNIVRGKGK